MQDPSVRITYFSDVLCIWAYVAQIRCDELRERFGERVELERSYLQVFGNVAEKMDAAWSDRGGLAGYAAHVRDVLAGFPHAEAHPEVWLRNTPASSMPAHLVLCAVRRLAAGGAASPGAPDACAAAIREAFFRRCADVGDMRVLLEVVEAAGVAATEVERLVRSGVAHSELCSDLDAAHRLTVRTSPTFLFNDDRQRLTGNVGYRILEANVKELLERPDGQSSWC